MGSANADALPGEEFNRFQQVNNFAAFCKDVCAELFLVIEKPRMDKVRGERGLEKLMC